VILAWLIAIPLIGGLAAWLIGRGNSDLSRWISLFALVIDLILALSLWLGYYNNGLNSLSSLTISSGSNRWFAELNLRWIPQLGVGFHLAIDGLSLLMVILTIFLGMMSVVISWTEIKERIGFFHLNLMLTLSGIIGVFLALDLFLFYFFWELMLVPMYFLINIWGHENRVYAAVKFFLFTQLSGLLMLLAILGLYFIHGKNTGVYTFDYTQLLGASMDPTVSFWLMMGFLIAFAVKLPAFPLHTWLPDAHTEAPTAGSVILAGLLLKTGAYGMLRFSVPLFPEASAAIAPWAMIIGVIGIIYGASLAFAQTDLKRLVAYTSVSHMGFVFIGIYGFNELALEGAVMQMLSHGISTGALFMLAGALQERTHTRDIDRMGGLWRVTPVMGGMVLVFVLASLGLPGMGNFVAEILVLIGSYRVSIPITAAASAGFVFATIYALWIIHRVFHGAQREKWKIKDLSMREISAMAAMIVVILWLGLYPQPFLDTAQPALKIIRQSVEGKKITAHAQGQHVRSFDKPAMKYDLLTFCDIASSDNAGGSGE
jgi:NADH-quinone oxidoreductase subunit M